MEPSWLPIPPHMLELPHSSGERGVPSGLHTLSLCRPLHRFSSPSESWTRSRLITGASSPVAGDVGVARLRSSGDGEQVVQLKDQATAGCRVPVGDETTELRSKDIPLVGSEHRIQGSDFGVVLPEVGAELVH